MLTERMTELDDATAVGLLMTITKALERRADADLVTEPTPEVQHALTDFAGTESTPETQTVTEGELARQALLVLAEDEQQATVIQTLLDGPAAESYSVAGTILAIGAVLVALQTRVKFVRKDNGWGIEVSKPGMPSKQLVQLTGKFTDWLKSNPR